ncbi:MULTISPECIES: hypothetical protein [Pseudofrankia]|uniref:hypothetical protein n=1 Tax=Pseudofrankia TaxID=2994363 RepID=UPI000234CBA7|nr:MULTISPECIES: hypothetical protein [Pseudofrankia]OHV31444.1 hypothetical protein BCD49_31635 [Pseudofrankia sp. EUN1h]
MKTARNVVILLVVLGGVLFGVHALEEATEYHGGSGTAATTTVVFTVQGKRFTHGSDLAATTLWETCVGTLEWSDTSTPVRQADGSYQAVVHPSLPADTRRRLRGCLEDLTLDRIRGSVTRMAST